MEADHLRRVAVSSAREFRYGRCLHLPRAPGVNDLQRPFLQRVGIGQKPLGVRVGSKSVGVEPCSARP